MLANDFECQGEVNTLWYSILQIKVSKENFI